MAKPKPTPQTTAQFWAYHSARFKQFLIEQGMIDPTEATPERKRQARLFREPPTPKQRKRHATAMPDAF